MPSNDVDEQLLEILDDHGHAGANGENRTELNHVAAKKIVAWADRRAAAVLERIKAGAVMQTTAYGELDALRKNIARELAALTPKPKEDK